MGKKGGNKKKGRKGSNPSPNKKPSKENSTSNGDFVPSSSKTVLYRSVPGLKNLGNTCFFNAVMQSLSQSHYFRLRLQHLEMTHSFEQDLQLPNSEEVLRVHVTQELGPLTTNLRKFLLSMQEKSAGILNPQPVFTEICKKASRFSSHAQQDSQELLHHLLDAVRLEEIHRIKHAILLHFGMGKSGTPSKNVTDAKRDGIKAYGRQATLCRTFVDEVFGGTLVSTVTCDVCNSCTKVQETFLDLSLPVSDDKSQGGHRQDKNKKNQNLKYGNDSLTQTETTQVKEEKEDGRTLSKHQKKKLEKGKRKAEKIARKAEKRKKVHHLSGLEQLVKTPVMPDNSTPAASTLEEDVNNSPLLIPSDHESSDGAEPDQESEGCGLVDPATGEHSHATPTGDQEAHEQENKTPTLNEAGTQQTSSVLNSEDGGIGMDGEAIAAATSISSTSDSVDKDIACAYASSGPQTDTLNAPTNELASNTTADTGLVDGNLNTHNNNNIEHAHSDDVDPSGNDGVQGGSGGGHGNEEEEEEGHTSTRPQEPEPDSVAKSLKDFCATEKLEGDNKFACIQCTNKAIAEKRAKQAKSKVPAKEKQIDSPLARGDSNGNICEEAEVVMEPGSSYRVENGNSSDQGVEDLEGDGRSGTEDGSTHDSLALAQESSEEEDLQSVGVEENEDCLSDIKFCDATKQLLIQTPPIVLTLHMKRFSQHGRQLRKNSKHIKFPFLLNISRHCMNSSKKVAMCDRSGRMLYSLVAVVEHSGSMFGGHYVAYVKQRQPVSTAQLEQTCTWRIPTTADSGASSSLVTDRISSSSPTPDNSVAPSTTPIPDHSISTPSASSHTPNSLITPSISPTPDNSAITPIATSPAPATPATAFPTPDASTSHDASPESATGSHDDPLPSNSSTTNSANNSRSSTPTNTAAAAAAFPTPDASTSHDSSPESATGSHDDPLPSNSSTTNSANNSKSCTPTDSHTTTVTSTPDNSDNTLDDNSSSTPDDSITCDSSSSTEKSTPAESPGQQNEPGASWEQTGTGMLRDFDEAAAEGQWYLVSDTHVTKTSPEEVQRSQAYLLFYELLPFRTS